MSIEEFNRLVEEAYDAAFSFEVQLIEVYERAYGRQGDLAIHLFEQETGMAAARIAERASLRLKADAWTPPVVQTLTDGMSEQEVDEANRVRDEAAAAIMAVFLTLGITGFAIDFMESISLRAQVNFEQELLRNLRKIVSDSFAAGKTAEETAVAIRETFANVTRVSSEMLAQTELTSLVNERSVVAAQKAFPDGVSKTWLSVGDNRVRAAHAAAVGQTVPIDQPFSVGGASLMYPGDPAGPLRLVARCRCRLSYTDEPTTVVASADGWYSEADEWYESDPPVIAYDQVSQAADLAIVAALHGLADKMEQIGQRTEMVASAFLAFAAPDTEGSQRSLDAVEALQQVAERLASAVERIADNPVEINVPEIVVPPAAVKVVLQAEPEKQITIERDATGRIVGATVEESPGLETELESSSYTDLGINEKGE